MEKVIFLKCMQNFSNKYCKTFKFIRTFIQLIVLVWVNFPYTLHLIGCNWGVLHAIMAPKTLWPSQTRGINYSWWQWKFVEERYILYSRILSVEFPPFLSHQAMKLRKSLSVPAIFSVIFFRLWINDFQLKISPPAEFIFGDTFEWEYYVLDM